MKRRFEDRQNSDFGGVSAIEAVTEDGQRIEHLWGGFECESTRFPGQMMKRFEWTAVVVESDEQLVTLREMVRTRKGYLTSDDFRDERIVGPRRVA